MFENPPASIDGRVKKENLHEDRSKARDKDARQARDEDCARQARHQDDQGLRDESLQITDTD